MPWTDSDIDLMIAHLRDSKNAGDVSEGGWKKTVWTTLALKYTDTSKQEVRVLESKWTRMKADYKAVKFIREQSGFGWDEKHQWATAESEVWNELITVRALYITIKTLLILTVEKP
jgi:hypothetical protein